MSTPRQRGGWRSQESLPAVKAPNSQHSCCIPPSWGRSCSSNLQPTQSLPGHRAYFRVITLSEMNETLRYFRVTHDTHATALKSTSTVTCATKSSSYNWHSSPEGFSWGIATWSSAGHRQAGKSSEVSSQRAEFLFQTQKWKFGCPPWIQQQGAFLSHLPLLSCCSTLSNLPGRF